MDKTILIVTAMIGAENLARAISRDADVVVEVAHSRRAALARLRRGPVHVLVVDATLPEREVTTADAVWHNAGGAVPLEINLGVVGGAGVIRLLRSVLLNREETEQGARRDATFAVAQELRSTVTSLLLESDLILRDKAVPAPVVEKVMHLRELADTLRTRLQPLR